MNYYERHIGDYLKDTSHLSLLEHGVYTRLLDVYYTREGAIPHGEVARFVGARTPAEKAALKSVLEEFFELSDGHWHQGRADAEIARYHQAAPDREAKKENAAERQRLTRERRKLLFELLRSHGIVPAYDTPMSQLQALASQLPSQPVTGDVTPPVTRDATATHTQSHTQSQKENTEARTQPGAPPDPDLSGFTPTPAGAVCKAMRQAGFATPNPGDPRLLALLQRGIPQATFVAVATEAAQSTPPKGWAWVLKVVEARQDEAAAMGAKPAVPAADPNGWTRSRSEVINRANALGLGPWDEGASYSGGESWAAYLRRVIAADARQRTGEPA